jgi:deoxyribodipyrimidine photo-lyase
MKEEIAIFWFRRDLRLYDNAGLYNALKGKYKILPIFIFDTQILDKLEDKKDRRVHFIQYQLTGIKSQLRSLGSDLFVKYGNPIEIWKELFQAYEIKAIYTNHDYEAYAIERDSQVKQLCSTHNASFFTFKDQCIFEKSEILSGSGTPYTVFTPYSRKWKEKLTDFYIKPYPTEKYYNNFLPIQDLHLPSLQEMGFETTDLNLNKPDFNLDIIKNYTANRDIPSIKGTSRLSIHLRFGSVSIRECVAIAKKNNETWLNELIWREFFIQILFHFHSALGS